MRILVTGASGQLGFDVVRRLKQLKIECIGVSSRDFDIADMAVTAKYIKTYAPDAVIHCAAYTAVDKAEDEIELCNLINVIGTKNIACVCRDIGAKMLYISTDYVFRGEGNSFQEIDDLKDPVNVYGKSKLAGELIIQEILDKYFIVRISWVFGINGNNFIKTMLRLGKTKDEINVVNDQIGSPTYTFDLAILLCEMINTDKYGIYHATNEGICSWAEFAQEIFFQRQLSVKVNGISSLNYPTKAVRPTNSRMNKTSLDMAGFSRLPSWKDALKRYLQEVE